MHWWLESERSLPVTRAMYFIRRKTSFDLLVTAAILGYGSIAFSAAYFTRALPF